MRIVEHWLATSVLVLFVPTLVQAQAPTRADLVGTWMRTAPWQAKDGRQVTEVDTLTFRADSTWQLSYVNEENTGGAASFGRWPWSVAGDTLWLGQPAAPRTIQGRTVIVGALPNRVTLKGQELTIVMPIKGKTETYVYQRLSAAKP